jgi:hypothetical protein
VRSDVIDGTKIKYLDSTAPATPVPAHSYFTVVNTGLAVGDVVETILKKVNFSLGDWTMKTVPYVLTSTTVLTMAQGIAKQIIRNLQEDYYLNNRPQVVWNNAGYKGIYATEAAAESAVGGLTDGDLVWVIANEKAYTVAKSGGTDFADDFDEKTDWSSEITAGTAEYINDPKYYHVLIRTVSAVPTIWIIDKKLTGVLEKFDNKAAYTDIGVITRDVSSMDAIAEWTVTKVGRVLDPCDPQQLANLEYHLDKKIRQYGKFNYKEFPFVPTVDTTKQYWIIDLVYEEADIYNSLSRPIAGKPEISQIKIALDASADATTILGLINLAKNGAALAIGDLPAITLNALSDVVITSGTTGDVIQLASDGLWKNVASDT